jgi:hypothetical protein
MTRHGIGSPPALLSSVHSASGRREVCVFVITGILLHQDDQTESVSIAPKAQHQKVGVREEGMARGKRYRSYSLKQAQTNIVLDAVCIKPAEEPFLHWR